MKTVIKVPISILYQASDSITFIYFKKLNKYYVKGGWYNKGRIYPTFKEQDKEYFQWNWS